MTTPTPADPTPTTTPTSEPVLLSHAVTVLVAAVVAILWKTVPSNVVDALATVAAFAVATGGAWLARQRVTPVAPSTGTHAQA